VSSKPTSKKPPARAAKTSRATDPSPRQPEAGGLEALAEAIESGAGLPEVARAAARVLEASVALIDRSSAVLAVAALSSAEEKRLLEAGSGVIVSELRVADAVAGELRYRPQAGAPDGMLTRMVSTMLALEVERARAPEWASDEAAGELVRAILGRRVTDRGDIVARAAELGADVENGGGVVIARAMPHAAQTGDWRARVLTVAQRALRAAAPGALAALGEGESAEVIAIVPCTEAAVIARAAGGCARELDSSLGGFAVTVAHSRWAQDPVDLYRAGKEAMLAANVGEAEGIALLAFEDTGSYRLLLPAMSEDQGELERFYGETVAPLAAYDEQYETDLVTTVETYLENDGNVTPTAEQLFTHRHTIRYRLERVKELSGHDISSTEGRERLGLGLKAMRVLGIAPPRGPAAEPGTEAGRIRKLNEEL
jgi:PucR family transcriptional regulator, purine catabolism regulatory protein